MSVTFLVGKTKRMKDFNGQRYTARRYYSDKRSASSYAAQVREIGNKARVIGEMVNRQKRYYVYTKKGHY